MMIKNLSERLKKMKKQIIKNRIKNSYIKKTNTAFFQICYINEKKSRLHTIETF